MTADGRPTDGRLDPEQLEEAVAEFLDRRASEPSLAVEGFAARWPGAGPQVARAIRTALELSAGLAEEPAPPRRIGDYEVLGELGRGGMGIVYRVEREGRAYAIKLLPLAPVVGPRLLERFRREAHALGQLSHPNIVRVHESGMSGEVPYLVMDCIDGQPLHELAPALPTAAAVRLVETLARALEAAHGKGVLHRDLKPHNVIVRPDGEPVLVDFGLSVAEEFPTLTATGEVVGTPRYMAPEQLGGGGVDARTDVYALGLILYELVLRRPARGASTRDALLDHVRRGRVPRPRAVNRAVPRELEKILLTALARAPARRYAGAGALADDLARFLRSEPVAARPPGRLVGALEAARDRSAAMWATATMVAVLAALAALVAPRLGSGSADRRRAAAPHVDRAVVAWLDGDSALARNELARALRLDPGDPTARLLAEHGSPRPRALESPCLRAAQEGLRALEAGDGETAMARLRTCAQGGLRPSFLAAALGVAAVRDSPAFAAEQLAVATRELPPSVRLQRSLGRAYDRGRRFDEALAAYDRALARTRDPSSVWADIAEVHFHQRDLPAGLAAIARAESLAGGEDRRILRLRANLEVHSGRHAEGRRRLARLLELDPGDAHSRYQMGYSYDLEHRMVEAEAAYREAARLDPRRADALVCLANLHAGASRGQCRGCDAAYAAHPAYYDLRKAEAYVLRTLEVDRGRTEWVMQSARDVATRLPRRGAVIAQLERLTVGAERTPGVLRLEEMLRRLRLVGG